MTQKKPTDRKYIAMIILIIPLIKYFVIQKQIWPKDNKPLQWTVLIMLLIFYIYDALTSWSLVDPVLSRVS